MKSLKRLDCLKNERTMYLCTSLKLIEEQDKRGWIPLIVAIYVNNHEMSRFLIEKCADVFVKNNNGTNLLMYAKEACKTRRTIKCMNISNCLDY